MPPADRTLPLPRSRDGPGLQLLRSRFLQPAAWRGLREVISVFLILGAVPEVATSGEKKEEIIAALQSCSVVLIIHP